MQTRWLIVADDLTGAADCAIAFAERGIETAVVWHDERGGEWPHSAAVISYNADTRSRSSAHAGLEHRAILQQHLHSGIHLYKKIDSTLRGHPAAEIAATMQVIKELSPNALGILAPAFPATGRTTRGGRVYVDGEPLEATEVWRRDHTYSSGDLLQMLETVDIRGASIAVDLVRSRADRLRAVFERLAADKDVIAVCDAMTQDDLERIVASVPLHSTPWFIGSAGLAHALASALPRVSRIPIDVPASAKGTLVVVGSLASQSKDAARSLAMRSEVRHVSVAPRILLHDSGRACRIAMMHAVVEGLEKGDDVLVELLVEGEPDLSLGTSLAEKLGSMLELAANHMGGLIVTGGETAAAVLRHLGISGIRLLDEIEPGLCLGFTLGEVRVPIVSKSGAFGDAESLIRIATYLRQLGTSMVREIR